MSGTALCLILGLCLVLGVSAAQAGEPLDTQVQMQRQDLRIRQNTLTAPELREGERRLDAIQNKAANDPVAAQQMLQIYRTDQSLATVNRPIPGGMATPGLVGPAERR